MFGSAVRVAVAPIAAGLAAANEYDGLAGPAVPNQRAAGSGVAGSDVIYVAGNDVIKPEVRPKEERSASEMATVRSMFAILRRWVRSCCFSSNGSMRTIHIGTICPGRAGEGS